MAKGLHGIELLSEPGKKLIIPEPSGGFPVGHAVVAVLAMAGAIGWTFFAMERGDGGADPRLGIAEEVVTLGVADMKEDLAGEARLTADDARIRTTLATPEIDRGTIEDVLEDVRKAGDLTGVAVFDARGKSIASVGPAEIAEIDLSVTRLPPGEGRLWALANELLVVSQASVQLGSDTWSILLARRVASSFVEKIAGATKVSIAVGMEGRALATGLVDPTDAAPLEDAIKSGQLGARTHAGRELLVKTLESNKRPILIAATSTPKAKSRTLMWLPLLLIALSSAASIIVAYRR